MAFSFPLPENESDKEEFIFSQVPRSAGEYGTFIHISKVKKGKTTRIAYFLVLHR